MVGKEACSNRACSTNRGVARTNWRVGDLANRPKEIAPPPKKELVESLAG